MNAKTRATALLLALCGTPLACSSEPGGAQAALSTAVGQGIGLAVSRATDAQASQYADVLAQVTGVLLAKDPDACGRLLLPQTFGAIGWDRFPAQHRARFEKLQQEIIATARSQPTPAPDEAEAGPLFDAIQDRLIARYGDDAIAGLNGEDKSAANTCRAWNRLYAAMAAAPPAEGGRVMRWLNAP
jgi:hypothetical protein